MTFRTAEDQVIESRNTWFVAEHLEQILRGRVPCNVRLWKCVRAGPARQAEKAHHSFHTYLIYFFDSCRTSGGQYNLLKKLRSLTFGFFLIFNYDAKGLSIPFAVASILRICINRWGNHMSGLAKLS